MAEKLYALYDRAEEKFVEVGVLEFLNNYLNDSHDPRLEDNNELNSLYELFELKVVDMHIQNRAEIESFDEGTRDLVGCRYTIYLNDSFYEECDSVEDMEYVISFILENYNATIHDIKVIESKEYNVDLNTRMKHTFEIEVLGGE